MTRKKRRSKEDVFELSDEVRDIEDSQSIKAIRIQEKKEEDYVADDALYTQEELEHVFDKSPPPAHDMPKEDESVDLEQEAIYAGNKEMDQALDAMAARKESQGSNEKPEAPAETKQTSKPGPVVPETKKIPFEIHIEDFCKAFTSAKITKHDDQQNGPKRLDVVGEAINGLFCRSELFTVSDIEEAVFFQPDLEQEAQENAQEAASAETAYKKAAFKAKALLNKNKAQLDEYLGRSLPDRDLPLEFGFASLKSKKEVESIVSTRSIRLLFTSKRESLHTILKKAEIDLANIAKCKLSKSHKLSLLDAYAPPLCEKIKLLITQFEKRPSVHEDTKRLELAEHAVHAVKQAITGYKQLYAELYESSNYLYGPQRGTANEIVCRLIDLLCLEQILLSTLHLPIPSVSIKTLNKLFHVLCHYEPQLIEEECTCLSWEALSSIKELYLVYQVMLSLQMTFTSATQHKLLKQYIAQHLSLLKIVEGDAVADIDEAMWVLPHDHSDAPLLNTPKEVIPGAVVGFPALYIQINSFFNQIIKDYLQCLPLLGNSKWRNSEGHGNSRVVLGAVSPLQAMTLLSVMNWSVCLMLAQDKPQSFSLYESVKLRVYSDFKDCFAYFAYLYYAQNKDKGVKDEQDSDKDLPVKPKPSGSQWWCAMEDDESMYLQTDEDKSAIAMDVGLLMLLVRSNEEREEVILVRTSRLERIQKGKLTLVVQKLGFNAMAIQVEGANGKPIPALVILHANETYLLTTHQGTFFSQQGLELCFPDKKRVAACVEGLASVSHNLQVVKLV